MKDENNKKVFNRTFICCMLCQVCHGTASYMANPLVSSYASFLGAGVRLVGLITGLYLGVSVIMRPFAGPAVVKLDKKKLLVLTYTIGAVVNFCYASFSSLEVFVVARMFHGIQYALMGTLLVTIAGDSLPKEKLGSGLGLFGISTAIAAAFGPSIGIAIRAWGTRSFGTVGGYKALFYAAATLVSLALIPCTLIKVKKRSKEELSGTGVWYKNIIAPQAVPSALCNMFFAVAFALYNAYMVPYAAEKGFGGISLFFSIYAAVMLVSRPLAGRLTDKFGASTVIYPCGLSMIISFILLWSARDISIVYLSAVFSALGYGAAYPAFQTNCLQSVPPIKRGVASNTSYFGIDLGGFIGPTYGGLVIAAFLKTGRAYSIMYLSGIIPVLLSLILLTFTKEYTKKGIEKATANEN